MVKTYTSMEEFQKIISIRSKLKKYSVSKVNSLIDFNNYIKEFDLIIADKNVKSHLDQSIINIEYIECTEETKSWDNLDLILGILVKYNLNQKSKVIIIGGGVLQDSVSFCCSIFNRGIPFEFAPTTLLSMCDSCIGGKTSINYFGFKNKLGNFYPPDRILINKEFLSTLEQKEVLSGLGEIFKFYILQSQYKKITQLSTSNISYDMIFDSLNFKAKIVENDEFDNGERIKLNYGHTFGHAIESTSNYKIPHGLGVVIGINIANYISYKLNFLSHNKYLKIKKMSDFFLKDLSVDKKWLEIDDIIPIIEKDKKNISGIRMMLLTNDGFKLEKMDKELLIKSFNEYKNDELK